MRHKYVRFLVVILAFIGLAFIRFRESVFFYDPLLDFFVTAYHGKPLPEIALGKYTIHLFFRYGLNTVLSLLIIWMVFKEKGMVQFALWIYLVVCVVLMVVLSLLIINDPKGDHFILFYVRRFLIQPLLLFLILPAFYYYRKHTVKS